MIVGIVPARILIAAEHRHDRAVAGMPLAAIGAAGEHDFEFLQLPFCGIDNHRERVIAARRDWPRTRVVRFTLEQLHGPLRRC